MQSSNHVIYIDRGWANIRLLIVALKGQGVKVGLRAGGPSKDGVPIIHYATWNEFGTADGRIPPRPFMRRTYDTSKEEAQRFAASLVNNLIRGKMSVDQLMHALGMWYQARIRATIRNSVSWAKPNAPSTIAMKGSSTPLIDDAMMIGNIDYERTKI